GIDDHDSYKLGCTTHFSTILISHLFYDHNIKILELPYLVRLNPNIPWKTRGNAAIRLEVEFNGNKKELLELISYYSEKYTKHISLANQYGRRPGIAIIEYDNYEKHKGLIHNFYVKAVTDVVPLEYAIIFSKKIKAEIQGNRGIIGSIASIGVYGNYTYELITYRKKDNWFTKRKIDKESIRKVDEAFFPKVFANYDYVKRKPLIISHGYDPILYGIRGIMIEPLFEATNMIGVDEDIDFMMLFKTNQGTDFHFIRTGDHYYQGVRKLIKIDNISVLEGGDVVITGSNGDVLIAFKETGELNEATKQLTKGDVIIAYGSIKPSVKFGKVIELEKIEIIQLIDIIYENPKCPKCNHSMESLGKNKGYRCRKCKYELNDISKVIKRIDRNISLGIYQSRYYRHLTRPIFLEIKNDSEKVEKIYLPLLLNNLKNARILD
ncbi:tRNA(Ile2) 2-agmatinylcytidine synthetase TiaS, partial [Sulfolobus sp. D5]